MTKPSEHPLHSHLLAESASRRSQSEFQRLLDKLPAGAYTCDATGLITYFNEQAAQLWGREPKLNDPVDRYCGSFRLFAVDGAPLRHDQCWMALAIQTGKEYNRQEIIIERPDGSRLSALAHANPIRDESGNLIGAMNVLVDISDQRQAEGANALLASIVESSDDAIISKTLEGRILSWNKGAERIFGYAANEAIGSSITIIIPSDRLDEEKTILAKLSRGERIDHYETVRVTKFGELIDISVTISPVQDESGRIIGASKVARDITARKQGDADLQRLHEMSLLLASTLELPVILDGTLRAAAEIEQTDRGLILLWDTEKKGLQVGARLGFDDDYVSWIESAPLVASASGVCYRDKQRHIIEDVENDDALPSIREVARRFGIRAVHSTPLISRSGEIIGVISLHFRQPRDQSQRVNRLIDLCARQAVDFIEHARVHEQLQVSNRYKDEFLATLAHELRNPLAPVSNALSLLRLCDDLSPPVIELRDIMDRQVSQIVRLVDDILEVSRIDRGKLELRREPVELAAIISRAVETSRPVIDEAEHQLAVTLPSKSAVLDADATRLAQVVSNLLNNAAKYTVRGGQIWLSARTENDEVVISVRDTGVGIPAEMLPRVFDMFSQVGNQNNCSKAGLGIGLALAKHLVELHGGFIEVRSGGLGKGSEFTVKLPLSKKDVLIAASPQTSEEWQATIEPIRVLVIDDSLAAGYMLGKLLERLGQLVHTENNPVAALEYAITERPEIVISDIGMPELNGYQFARRIRERPELDEMVLVALTGYGQERDKQQASEAGFDYHIVKPVSLDALQELLRTIQLRPKAIAASTL